MKHALGATGFFALLAFALTAPALLGRAALGPDRLLDWDPLYRLGPQPPLPWQGDYTPIALDYPRDLAVARGLESGRLDAWNPLSGCGAPLWAEQGGPFFPLKLPFYLAPSRRTYDLFLVLRLVFAALGAYLLARAEGLSPLPATAAGAAFEVSAASIAHLPFGTYSPASVLPWVLFGAALIARRRDATAAVAAALALGLAASGGHPTLELLDFLAFAASIAGHALAEWRRPRVALAVAAWSFPAVLLGLALAAPSLLPLAELSALATSYKGTSVGLEVRQQFLSQVRYFLTIALFAPRAIESLYRPVSTLLPFAAAVGVLTLVAAVSGMLRGALKGGLAGVLLLGVAMALDPPLIGWVGHAPGISLVLPTYAGSLLALVLTQAAGHGIRAAASPDERHALPFALAIVLAAGSLLFALGGHLAGLAGFRVLVSTQIASHPARILLPVAFAFCVTVACWILGRSRLVAVAGPALLLAMVADQAATMRPIVPQPRTEILSTPPSPAVRFLQERLSAGDARMMGLPIRVGHPLTPMLFGLPDFRGISALPVRRFRDYLELISPGAASYTAQEVKAATSPLLDLAAVRYVVVSRPDVPGTFHRRLLRPADVPKENDSEVELVHRDPRVDVYENRAALPRVRIVHQALHVADARAALDWLRSSAAGLRHADDVLARAVALEPDERGNPAPATTTASSPQESVRIVEQSDPDRLLLEAKLKEPGFVVIADTYYPGWKARLDGAPTSIYPADLLFRAVYVPAGAHALELTYEPASLRFGIAAFAIAALACVGTLAFGRMSRARRLG